MAGMTAPESKLDLFKGRHFDREVKSRPARSVAAADSRGGGRVRTHAHHRADAPGPSAQAGRRAPAAVDEAAFRLPCRPGRSTRPGRRTDRKIRSRHCARDVRLYAEE